MKRTKRYDDGGEVDPLEAANQSKESQEIAGEAILKGMRDTEAEKPSTFKDAFAAARKAGDKTFEFGGKKYTTEMASAKAAKVTDTGDELGRLAAKYKPPLRQQETMQDRADRYVAKRAAQRAEDAAARSAERSRMPASRPRASEQSFMGSLQFSKGGSTASKRADGIAQRGKTRGRIV